MVKDVTRCSYFEAVWRCTGTMVEALYAGVGEVLDESSSGSDEIIVELFASKRG